MALLPVVSLLKVEYLDLGQLSFNLCVIAKFSRCGIYITEIQAEILQYYQEVEVINHHYRLKY